MPARTDPDLRVGRHMATLNLFRESDGSMWLTVADAPGAIREADRLGDVPPMRVLAGWVDEAARRFVSSWSSYSYPRRHRSRPGG